MKKAAWVLGHVDELETTLEQSNPTLLFLHERIVFVRWALD